MMPRVAAILRFSAALLLFCGFSATVYAQLPELDARTGSTKFDEFGKVGHCDLIARLDNLTVLVQESPGAVAHVIYYGPPGAEKSPLQFIENYLVEIRALSAKQIKTTYGGRNSDLKLPKVQLWIVPRNAIPPEPHTHDSKVDTFKGLFDDDRAWDRIEIEFEDDVMGPGLSPTTYASFADMLDQQKNSVGYVVVYTGEDAVPGAWRRIAQDQLNYLKTFNADPERIKTIFGGYRKETTRQLWIAPKEAPPPVKDAGPELPLSKTLKVDDFYAETLGRPQNEINVFSRLKEVLTAQKNVRAFVVVRLEVPTPDETPVDDGSEPADLTKVVEKWRAELANTHKIFGDRFIVLFTTAPDDYGSHLRLWFVPKGQPLPDPHEDEEPEDEPFTK